MKGLHVSNRMRAPATSLDESQMSRDQLGCGDSSHGSQGRPTEVVAFELDLGEQEDLGEEPCRQREQQGRVARQEAQGWSWCWASLVIRAGGTGPAAHASKKGMQFSFPLRLVFCCHL